jgi:hypothetical protein
MAEGQALWRVFFTHSNPVCAVTGTNERGVNEAKVARIVAASFAVLWVVLLGLNMLSGI